MTEDGNKHMHTLRERAAETKGRQEEEEREGRRGVGLGRRVKERHSGPGRLFLETKCW